MGSLGRGLVGFHRAPRGATWAHAVGFGIAFAAVEALMVGIGALLNALAAAGGSLPVGAPPAGYGPAWAVFPNARRPCSCMSSWPCWSSMP